MSQGHFVPIVGPSGAGKDTLIQGARRHLGFDPRFVFPHRYITRTSSADEESIEVDPKRFVQMAADGAFALHWGAHDLLYGLPVTIAQELARGRTVIANVSRRVLAQANARFPRCFVIEITASEAVLANRLASRARPEDGDLDKRLARRTEVPTVEPHARILNEGTPENGTAQLIALLHTLADGP